VNVFAKILKALRLDDRFARHLPINGTTDPSCLTDLAFKPCTFPESSGTDIDVRIHSFVGQI